MFNFSIGYNNSPSRLYSAHHTVTSWIIYRTSVMAVNFSLKTFYPQPSRTSLVGHILYIYRQFLYRVLTLGFKIILTFSPYLGPYRSALPRSKGEALQMLCNDKGKGKYNFFNFQKKNYLFLDSNHSIIAGSVNNKFPSSSTILECLLSPGLYLPVI